MVDGFGKDSLNPNLEPCRYKDTVEVPLLGIVDDILIVSQSGHKTSRKNGLINGKTAIKSSQFGHEKCHVMHIGKNIPDHKKVGLFVDKWKMQEVQSVNTWEKLQEETHDGDHVINSVDRENI